MHSYLGFIPKINRCGAHEWCCELRGLEQLLQKPQKPQHNLSSLSEIFVQPMRICFMLGNLPRGSSVALSRKPSRKSHQLSLVHTQLENREQCKAAQVYSTKQFPSQHFPGRPPLDFSGLVQPPQLFNSRIFFITTQENLQALAITVICPSSSPCQPLTYFLCLYLPVLDIP